MKYYKFALYKKYFDLGLSLMNLPKYILAAAGGGSLLLTGGASTNIVVLSGIGFGIFCFFIGWLWLKLGILEAEYEVRNRFDPFIKEMRNNKKLFGLETFK